MTTTATTDTALVAELNDLLQLDHDAVEAYSLALKELDAEQYKQRVREFRGDHERHIAELTSLIRSAGGVPIQLPHIPTGAFKLAVQAVGAVGGDRAVITAFKANERQVRDKYRRAASRPHEGNVAPVLSRAADDEARHYAWALETLEELGFDPRSATGRAERAFETAHKGMADVVEGGERRVMRAAAGARQALTKTRRRKVLGAALLAVGAGVMAVRMRRQKHAV